MKLTGSNKRILVLLGIVLVCAAAAQMYSRSDGMKMMEGMDGPQHKKKK
jgi:hypothetical protein